MLVVVFCVSFKIIIFNLQQCLFFLLILMAMQHCSSTFLDIDRICVISISRGKCFMEVIKK